MSYKHGVYASELPTSVLPPRRIGAALPVVVGTAPVHLAEDGNGPVDEPILVYTYDEAVKALGYSTDWAAYTLCEFIKCMFGLYGAGPMVLINVFDPATHYESLTGESYEFDINDEITLDAADLVADPVVTNDDGTTTYVLGTDYTVDWATGVITRLDTGSIASREEVLVNYDVADPGLVAAADIIGGPNQGLQLVEQVFPRFRMVPGQIVAPAWSTDTSVAAEMLARAQNINGLFKAHAIVDINSNTVTDYTNVAATKNSNNLTDEQHFVCWPKVSLGGVEYWMSSHLAGLIAQVDADNDDIPYKSPSNKRFQIDSVLANGSEVFLTLEQANLLNSNGVVTALNWIGGWKCWGNRTGAYPAVTDVKDSFIPIRRMFNWIANTVVTTYWQKVDFPLNRRLVDTVVDSTNIWLNGLAARGAILAGRLEFNADENPSTDLMDGIIRLHLYVTPPSPAREIDFILEYDPDALETLFG
jgi:phage tail sheath protein FI